MHPPLHFLRQRRCRRQAFAIAPIVLGINFPIRFRKCGPCLREGRQNPFCVRHSQIRNTAFFFNPAAITYNPERVHELKAPDKWKWWTAIAIVVVFTAIEYGPVFLSGRIPFPATVVNGFAPYIDEFPQGASKPLANIGDLVTSFYPYHALAARAFRQGSLPLWDSNILSGAPFVGSTQSAIFYPPNYLYYFLE